MNGSQKSAGAVALDYYADFMPERMTEINLGLRSRQEASDLLYAYWQNYEAPIHFDTLQLGFYEDKRGNFLLGSTNETLHRHDRWQYMSPEVEAQEQRVWYEIYHHETASFKVTSLEEELRMEVNTMRSLDRKAPLGLGPSGYWRVARAPFYVADLGWPSTLSPADMHDLFFHYDVWVSRNSEFADMPKNVVQRMHGLGTILDSKHHP